MNIMVAVDPRAPGNEVQHAIGWAARLDAKLHLRGVSQWLEGDGVSSLSPDDLGSHVKQWWKEDRAALEALQHTIPPSWAAPAKLLRGSPGGALVDESEAFDLVLVGRSSRSNLNRLFLGSVAERLVRIAPCPVIVCPTGSTPVERAGPVKVLCPIDASDVSLDAATRMRGWLGSAAEIHLAYALPDLFASRRIGRMLDVERPEQHPFYDDAKEHVDEALAGSDLELAGVHYVLSTSHHPARDLAAFRETLGAEVLAMPTHGRKGVAKLQFGSVTERVLRLSTGISVVVR